MGGFPPHRHFAFGAAQGRSHEPRREDIGFYNRGAPPLRPFGARTLYAWYCASNLFAPAPFVDYQASAAEDAFGLAQIGGCGRTPPPDLRDSIVSTTSSRPSSVGDTAHEPHRALAGSSWIAANARMRTGWPARSLDLPLNSDIFAIDVAFAARSRSPDLVVA